MFSGDPGGMVLVMDFDSAEEIAGRFESDSFAVLVPVGIGDSPK